MELKLGLIADSANISLGGKLNVLGQFTNINVRSGFPMRWPSMVLVLNFEGSMKELDEKHELLIRGVDEDGIEFLRIEAEFTFPNPENVAIPPTAGQILRLRDVVFPRPGVYAFEMSVNERYLDAIPINVIEIRSSRE